MKKSLAFLLALLFLSTLFLSACSGPSLEQTGETMTEEKTSEVTAPNNQNKTEGKPTETGPKEQEDPAADTFYNVLIIGNSFSTGWPDELNGLFTKAGNNRVNIFTVYYSGCRLDQHWDWLKKGLEMYRLRHHVQAGSTIDYDDVSLEYCLAKKNWDVISIQQAFSPTTSLNYEKSLESCIPYAENLVGYLREHFPKSRLIWQQNWAYEVGWSRNGVTVTDKQYQDTNHQNVRAVSQKMATDLGLGLAPCGDGFYIARNKYQSGDLSRDLYHDGPENGGQYLNACVWFETLTGQSCIGNTWRPTSYKIAEERILMLQQAAHEAVEQNPIKK